MTVLRSNKGQVFLLIAILLVIVIVAFVLLSTQLVRVRRAPTVQDTFWEIDGQKDAAAKVGAEVNAHVKIKATEEYAGSVVVKIRKDVALWFDSDYYIMTVPVSLAGGKEKEIEISFIPDQPSSNRLRGYFIEVDFTATRTKWVMEDSYPPRLRVT